MLEGLECLRCWTDHPTWTRFSRNNYTQWVSRCGLASNSVTWLEICFLFCFFFPSAWESNVGVLCSFDGTNCWSWVAVSLMRFLSFNIVFLCSCIPLLTLVESNNGIIQHYTHTEYSMNAVLSHPILKHLSITEAPEQRCPRKLPRRFFL